jgi:hypothetical protein
MDDYLAKPVRFEQLAGLCERIVSEATPSGPATAPPPDPARTLFDPDLVHDAVGAEHAPAVLEIFLEQQDHCVSELAAALATNDLPRAGRVAHKLKGSAAVIGAHAVAAVCQEICTLSPTPGADLEPPHLALRAATADTAAAIRAHIDGLASAA